MSLKEVCMSEVYDNDPELKKEDVENLREWIERQPHLPKVTELQIALFLHSCYYNSENAKSTTETYFTMKTMCPEIFGNRDPLDKKFKIDLDCLLITPLPKLTPEKHVVVFVKMLDCDPKNFNLANELNHLDMVLLLYLHQKGPAEGVVLVLDMEGIIFGHFLKLSITVIKKFLFYLQEGMPIRLKNLHFLNIVSFMDKIMALMKPFMKTELVEALILHKTVDTVLKYIPVDVLPKEYGGSCDSLTVLQEKCKRRIIENRELFKFQDSQVADESKRPENPKNDFFKMEGSFKKLEVD